MFDPAVEPNDTALEILKRLWRDGELSARAVRRAPGREGEAAS
jgi:hypothetical protein